MKLQTHKHLPGTHLVVDIVVDAIQEAREMPALLALAKEALDLCILLLLAAVA